MARHKVRRVLEANECVSYVSVTSERYMSGVTRDLSRRVFEARVLEVGEGLRPIGGVLVLLSAAIP